MVKNKPLMEMCQSMIKKISVYSGEFELIDSNSVLYYDSEVPLEIELFFTDSFKIRIVIKKDTDDSGEHNLKFNVDEEKNIIEYTCINFDNPFGTGTKNPIELCTVEGKRIYIHFWIYTLGEKGSSRKIEYSLWKEK